MAKPISTAAALAIMAVAGIAQPAAAQPAHAPAAPGDAAVITRIDPQQAVELLQEAGYRASITHTEARQVEIETRMAGMTVYLTLLGCAEGRQCSSLQMRLTANLPFFGLGRDRADLDAAMIATNRWGHHRRYSVAYVYHSRNAGEHLVAFATDHALFPGTTRQAIGHTIRNYADLAGEFAAFMRDPANRSMPNS